MAFSTFDRKSGAKLGASFCENVVCAKGKLVHYFTKRDAPLSVKDWTLR